MASDPLVSQELKSLQEELAASRRERAAAAQAPPVQPSMPPEGEGSADKHEWRDQLGELANAITSFLEEAEKDIAAHPAQSVIGALVVGILIGRMLGRR